MAASARDLFGQVAAELASSEGRYMGLCLDELCRFAAEVAAGEGILTVSPDAGAGVVFGFMLQPE